VTEVEIVAEDIGDALVEVRALAEALMLDTCVIRRPSDAARTWDETTGEWSPAAADVVYSGRCKAQDARSVPRMAEVGHPYGLHVADVVSSPTLHLPVVESAAVVPGDVAEITAAVYDPALVGQMWRVYGPHAGSLKTARRLPCEVVA